MTEMTADTAAALRKPFDRGAVGKLPKPTRRDAQKGKCNDCGGYHGMPAVHLDYVGHAATTDRLLAVDPSWTWEPMATTPEGLPMPDGHGNLWIRLTVCGVTRIGVGDGASIKEQIGDAIRNAAMRFGVALDLWSKEELESVSGEHAAKVADSGPPMSRQAPPPEPDPAEPSITDDQRKKLQATASELGLTREQKVAGAAHYAGREITSTNELTAHEASLVIDALVRKAESDPNSQWDGAADE